MKIRLFLPGKKGVIPIKLLRLSTKEMYNKFGFIFIFISVFIFISAFSLTVIGEEIIARGETEGLWADSISTSLIEGSVSEVVAEGNSLMVYDNYKIEADFINYNMQTDDIIIKGSVFFDNGEYNLYTDEIIGNLLEQEFEAIGDVRLEGEQLNVSSEGLLIKEQSHTMTFTGNVAFKYNEIEAVADIVRYDSETQIAILEGNVKGQHGSLSLSGGKMEINLKNEKMKLLGKAELLFNNEGEE